MYVHTNKLAVVPCFVEDEVFYPSIGSKWIHKWYVSEKWHLGDNIIRTVRKIGGFMKLFRHGGGESPKARYWGNGYYFDEYLLAQMDKSQKYKGYCT